jgi:hypothetical protein
LDADQLDYDRFADLQRQAFAKTLQKARVLDSYMKPEFYRWKFHTPAGSARIALVREDTEILSVQSIVPWDITIEGHVIKGWQLCDAATNPKVRSKGYWPGCFKRVRESIGQKEVLFGFANKNSIGGSIASGLIAKANFAIWSRPVLLSRRNIHPDVTLVAGFDGKLANLTKGLAKDGEIILTRSVDYLNWRYTQNPTNEYTSFIFSKSDENKGFAVIRVVHALNRRMVVLMELWGSNRSVKRALIQSIATWAASRHYNLLVFQDNLMSLLEGFGYGFVLMPAFLPPKRQVLVLYTKSQDLTKQIAKSKWHTQWGDWDGF